MAVQVGRGVEYLHSRQFVHRCRYFILILIDGSIYSVCALILFIIAVCVCRDIASRNCMVTLNKTIKLGDFGLTRKVGDSSDYYRYRRSGQSVLLEYSTDDRSLFSYCILYRTVAHPLDGSRVYQKWDIRYV